MSGGWWGRVFDKAWVLGFGKDWFLGCLGEVASVSGGGWRRMFDKARVLGFWRDWFLGCLGDVASLSCGRVFDGACVLGLWALPTMARRLKSPPSWL